MSEKEQTNQIIKETLIEKGADFVALFGSYARGEERSDSDIDVLVNFSVPVSLFDHSGIEIDLEKKTGRKIDLVTRRALSKYVQPFVQKDMKILYEARQ